MKAVAAVPSRDELLSKLLGSLQSPITNLARVLNQIAEQGGEVAEAPAAAESEEAADEQQAESEPSARRFCEINENECKRSLSLASRTTF